MKWIDNQIKKKVRSAMVEWLTRNKGLIDHQKQETEELKRKVSLLESEIEEIQQINMKVPIEEYIYNSDRFQSSLKEVGNHVEAEWGQQIKFSLPNLNGTITQNEAFECTINEDVMIVMAGLKTRYFPENEVEDKASYQMEIGDTRIRPFLIDAETRHVVFLKPFLLKGEYIFLIRQTEGRGTLEFSLIGATLSRPHAFNRTDFELQPTKTCFICGGRVDSKEAIEDAKLLEKYTGQTSGILCCSCFKVAKVIIDGKTEGGG